MKIIKTPAEIDTRLKSFVVVADSETAMKNSIDIVREYGYEIKILDFWHKDISCHYNPFKYVHSVQDVYEMADCLSKIYSKVIPGQTYGLFYSLDGKVVKVNLSEKQTKSEAK